MFPHYTTTTHKKHTHTHTHINTHHNYTHTQAMKKTMGLYIVTTDSFHNFALRELLSLPHLASRFASQQTNFFNSAVGIAYPSAWFSDCIQYTLHSMR
jgi:hypothetical protein